MAWREGIVACVLDEVKQRKLTKNYRSFVNTLLHNMRYGARIGYAGDRSFLIANNLCFAYTSPNHVSEYLAVECAEGRMAGPYPSLPHPSLRCSGIGLVPKKSGKLRLIMHLSAPKDSVLMMVFPKMSFPFTT